MTTKEYSRLDERGNGLAKEENKREYLFSSESVSAGHPDKLADQISDRIVDLYLAEDSQAKVAAECLIASNLVVIAGETHSQLKRLQADIQSRIPDLVRETLKDVGYDGTFPGIDPARCIIKLHFNNQSEDIQRGVERFDGEQGAGDQGLMFGYACSDTPELMPLPISLAHKLVRRQSELRKAGDIPWLKPDAKSQVSVRYHDHEPISVEAVVLSTQHAEGVDLDHIKSTVREAIIEEVIPASMRSRNMKLFINPTGRFVVGGPQGDTGLTGRKIIVDTYGGFCPHGGGAFSGKDPSKVDRSAAYAARQVAKTIVAADMAKRCTVQLAYAIGVSEPVSIMVDSHGTGALNDSLLERLVSESFDLTPRGIIKSLRLKRPVYTPTAVFGHFGRSEPEFTWEDVKDGVARLKAEIAAGDL